MTFLTVRYKERYVQPDFYQLLFVFGFSLLSQSLKSSLCWNVREFWLLISVAAGPGPSLLMLSSGIQKEKTFEMFRFRLKVWIHIAFAKYFISFSFLYGWVRVCVCSAYQQMALAKEVTVLSANSFKWFISWTGRFSSNRVLSKSSLQIQETIVPPTGSCFRSEDEPSPSSLSIKYRGV